MRGRAYSRYQRKRMIRRRMPLYPWVDKPGKLVIATAALANGAPRRDTRMLGASGSGRRGERLKRIGTTATRHGANFRSGCGSSVITNRL